jgi:hypothetical protein
LTTIAPPWSGYPTCSGFTPVYSRSPAPRRAVNRPKRRASQRGAIPRTLARPVNRVSMVIARPAAVRPTAIAEVKQRASKAHAQVANAKRAAAAWVTTRRLAPPTIAAASEASASSFPVRATGSGAPGRAERNALGIPTARRGSASTALARPVAARPTRTARRALATSGCVSTTSAAQANRAPRAARACKGCAFPKPLHRSDRNIARRGTRRVSGD